MKPFPPGTIVEWRSHANGNDTTKRGIVIGFIPKGTFLSDSEEFKQAPWQIQHRIRDKYVNRNERSDRYIVAVYITWKEHSVIRHRIFQPYVPLESWLTKAKPSFLGEETMKEKKRSWISI